VKILYHHRIRSKDGQYVHLEELTHALARLGHEIVMVGPSAVADERFGADAGGVAQLKRYLPRFAYELIEFAYAVLDYRRLARAIRAHRPDVLYERYNLYLPSGVWAHERFGLPMLLEVNAPLYAERKRYSGISLDRLARWTERRSWCGADRVLPVTQVLAEELQRTGVPAERIAVIPNGIDRERFARAPTTDVAKRTLGLGGRLVLGFVGFMHEWHGLERVVDLLAADKGGMRHLLLVGDGPARPSLERRAREHGVAERVTFTGVIERDRVADYVAAFDIALFQPELVVYASPLKLFEYLGLGRAIVAPATANIQEILTHEENALLFDPYTEGEFAAAVERLCNDAQLRGCLARGAADTIERRGLTWDNNARRVVGLFEALVQSRRVAAPAGERVPVEAPGRKT
jgi:glycosyltransferase involved in cell wall biosynthesis